MIKHFLNPKGHRNPISGSKVTAILLKGLLVELHREGSAPAAWAAGLFYNCLRYLLPFREGGGRQTHTHTHMDIANYRVVGLGVDCCKSKNFHLSSSSVPLGVTPLDSEIGWTGDFSQHSTVQITDFPIHSSQSNSIPTLLNYVELWYVTLILVHNTRK